LAAAQLRQARYGNVNVACHPGREIRGPSRDVETPTQAWPNGACGGGQAWRIHAGGLAVKLKTSPSEHIGLKICFLKKSSLIKMLKINDLKANGNRGFRVRMPPSVASG
jgi:hypothetical protein